MEHVLATFVPWINEYGSLALFILLALGIVALPIPEESLMVFTGFLMAKGTLIVPITIFACIGGALCGITLSYLLGRTAGIFFVKKCGRWIGLTEHKMSRVHDWFGRIGKWALFIGYFIPGVRHLTGYVAGTAQLEYRSFALFAYSGGIIWASLFLSMGYFFSNEWTSAFEFLHSKVVMILDLF